MQQLLPLYLPSTVQSDTHYIVTDCNRLAYKAIMHHRWEMPFTLLFGEACSGKTTLSHHICAQRNATMLHHNLPESDIIGITNGLYIIDNVHQCDERALFHMLNMIKAQHAFLLMTATGSFNTLPFTLPDTCSRLRTAMQCHIYPPDDDMMLMLLHKELSNRQLYYDEKLLHYVIPRLERSYQAIVHFVGELDRISLVKKHSITISLARELLNPT